MSSKDSLSQPSGSANSALSSVPIATPSSSSNPSPQASETNAHGLPLHPPGDISLPDFNDLVGDWEGNPVDDINRLFIKQVILDDQTTLNVETIKVPGFIGISDALTVTDPNEKQVSGHADIAKFLERDRLYICTFQWHKERYGIPFDTRRPLDAELFTEGFIKNEGHHSGAIVPARRFDQTNKLIDSFAALNAPNDYHKGMYGRDGYVAIAQRLVFPPFVKSEQAQGYSNSIVCWMGLLSAFVQFPKEDYNGGDPTHIGDRDTLREFLKNGLLASLEDEQAIAFFKDPRNKCYCAEFMFINLNTVLHPFNLKGLTDLLDGDASRAAQVMELQTRQNKRWPNTLSILTKNPEFKAYNIPMPVVPADLPPLDGLMTQNGQAIAPNSLPFPPFKISQVIRRAFHTLLPRHQAISDKKIADAQARMFKFMEPALIQQLGLGDLPATDLKVVAVHQFVELVTQKLNQPYATYDEFSQMVDHLMQQADEMLVGAGDRVRFVPPRIYVDLGQNDGDKHLPQGWGFRLETVGALVARSVIV
jgi:hypothetical protein